MSAPVLAWALLLWPGAFRAQERASAAVETRGDLRADAQAELEWTASELRKIATLSPLPAPPPDPTNAVADSLAAAELGRTLFFDRSFARDGRVSCATCHDPERAFSDGRATALGLGPLPRNTPSLLNAPWQRWQFWDGRADSLWSQALQPFEHPDEFGSSRGEVLRRVAASEELRRRYEEVFGKLAAPSSPGADAAFANLGKSLAAYQRRLVTGPSPFDVFAAGLAAGDRDRQAAISDSAKRGLKLFIGKADCRSCHNGPSFSDGEFHDIGLPESTPPDSGRQGGLERLALDPFNAAGAFSDEREGERARDLAQLQTGPQNWGTFRTPSLRNVSRTAPYMHAGQLASLADVLHFYSTREGARPAGHHGERVLRPLELTSAEQADLESFLRSLDGGAVDPSWTRPGPARQ
jgi:cytochrome c peroxidase